MRVEIRRPGNTFGPGTVAAHSHSCAVRRYSAAASGCDGTAGAKLPRTGVKLQRENGLRGYWNWPSNELLCCC